MKRVARLMIAVVVLSAGVAQAGGGTWRYSPRQWPSYAWEPVYPAPARRAYDDHCDHGPRVRVAFPYYCNVCRHGFGFEHQFRHHLQHDHRIPYDVIPQVVVRVGGVIVYAD